MAASRSNSVLRNSPRRRALSARCSRSTTSRTFKATAQASGVPPNVVACEPGPSKSAMGSRTQNAPIGKPLPNDFAIEIPSGRNPSAPGTPSRRRWKLWNRPDRK